MWNTVLSLIHQGGDVLWLLLATAIAIWTLIIERYSFIYWNYPRLLKRIQSEWSARADRQSWFARQIRRQYLSQIQIALHQRLDLLRALVAICPLLGLLGTVLGMIQVFDALALQNSPRQMADGISKATIPTMAGMVIALSSLYFSMRLKFKADYLSQLAADQFSD